MPTTTLMPLPKQQFLTNIGTPLSGGKVYTYAAGTSQPKATYSDTAGTVQQANPIRLNLRGEPESTIYWTGNYRVEVRSSLGNLIYTVDNFNTDPAGIWNIGQLLDQAVEGASSFTQAGAGAVKRTMQDKAREIEISITDFGASSAAEDNAAAIEKAIAQLRVAGGELIIPRGRFKTSGSHVLDLAGGIISVRGKGPASSVLVATGANTPLTITGASECAVRSVGFDKVTRDQAFGDGLRIFNTAYALVDHVTAYGFLNGIKTEAALTTLFSKVLTRECDIGIYLGRGPQSCPNAITLLNCSSSLNNRFGLRIDEGATITVIGGSIEGNGWGSQAAIDGFRGGVYLSNCGTEGGVAVTISGVQMEQNLGKADIHIAATKNPGTAYNVMYNTIFPIDNVHFTDNAVYVENSVDVVLNMAGNSFKHIGTYTPSADRKYIKSEAPLQVTINTFGDQKQFFSALQTPDLGAWGPNVYRGAMFSSRGTVAINEAAEAVISGAPYNLASSLRTGTGEITCNFAKAMKDGDYQVMVNPLLGAKTDVVISKTANYFTVQFRDLTGALVDSGFDFMVAGGV